MKEEASDELLIRKGNIDQLTWSVISGGENSCVGRNRWYAGIGDGDTVGITAEVVYGIAEAVESLFDEGTPVFEI